MQAIHTHIQRCGNRLCLGLDLDPRRVPERYHVHQDPLGRLAADLVDATADLVAAYKPNAAFFEQDGSAGWRRLEELVRHIGSQAFVIVDAKRGDIGNTSARYARALFDHLGAHAVTLAPYMGRDSLEPFLEGRAAGASAGSGQGAFVLALTSNPGAADFQLLDTGGRPLWWRVLEALDRWNRGWAAGRLGAVVGATRPAELHEVRQGFPDLPLLIPGVGAQGGDLEAVQEALGLGRAPALVNVSRDILYGSDPVAEPEAVRERAKAYARRLGVA